MKRECRLVVVVLALIALAGAAQAATVVLDGSAAATVGAIGSSAQSKVGSGSWQANGVSKSSLYLTPEMLFGSGATFQIKDIADFSWSTFRSTTGGSVPDWYLTIYTAPDGVSDDAGWYGRRLTFEGLYANNPSYPANTWITYQTGAGTNQVTMYDGNRGGNYGFYGGPTLDIVKAGPIDWTSYATSGVTSSTPVDYSTEYVKFIVLETGSGWAAGFGGYLDDFTIALSSGAATQVDLEPNAAVPEPMTVLLGIMGLGSVAGFRRFKK